MKLCECGCGRPTKPASQTRSQRGTIKGEPQKFVAGHSLRMNHGTRPCLDLAIRFWQHVRKGDRCWEWQSKRHRNGYGVIQIDGKGGPERRAHRIAWELTNGPIPPGFMVLHKCDNKPCVRPCHLYLGTAKENSRDAIERGLNAPPPLKKSRLTREQVASIRELFKRGGITKKNLARRNGLSETHLSRILQRDLAWA